MEIDENQIVDEYFLKDASIDSYVRVDKKIGTDYLHFFGLPGQAKSATANNIVLRCLSLEKEIFFTQGDKFCEWRHFLLYPKIVKKVTLIIPEGQEIHYDMPEDISTKYKVIFEKKEINYKNLNISDFINADSEREIFAIYDAHFKKNNFWRRTALWVEIADQLTERIILKDKGIGLLFHEAGYLFEEGAEGEHWKAIRDFRSLLPEFRKGYIRPIFISQLDTEIDSRIRKKCIWRIVKKGDVSYKMPQLVRKYAPFQARSQFIIMFGGLHILNNQVERMKEIHDVWKMIPIGFNGYEDDDNNNGRLASANNKSKKKEEQLYRTVELLEVDANITADYICAELDVGLHTARKLKIQAKKILKKQK